MIRHFTTHLFFVLLCATLSPSHLLAQSGLESEQLERLDQHPSVGWEQPDTFVVGDKFIERTRPLLHGYPIDHLLRVRWHSFAGRAVKLHGVSAWTEGTWDSLDFVATQPSEQLETSLHEALKRTASRLLWHDDGKLSYRLTSNDQVRLVASYSVVLDAPYEERRWVFDARTGAQLLDQPQLRHIDVNGNVVGAVTPGDVPYTTPTATTNQALGHLNVLPVGLLPIPTNAAGFFTIACPGGSLTLLGSLAGPFFSVENCAGPNAQFLTTITPGVPQTILLNDMPGEFTTAETNAFRMLGRSYDFVQALSPGFGPAQTPVAAYVNVDSTCFAFYSPQFASMYFTREAGGCPNAAYGSVVTHEYFHHLAVGIGGLNPAYDEAMADVMAAYVTESPTIGPDFFGPGQEIRSLLGTAQYPVTSSDPAEVGLPLAQAFWDLRIALQGTLGIFGDEIAELLWLTTILLGNGAVDDTVLETVLLADDDDADLGNGTPNMTEIVDAFTAHGFPEPLLPVSQLNCQLDEIILTITWSLPGTPFDSIQLNRDGLPFTVLPGDATSYTENPPVGDHFYSVVGISGSMMAPPVTCDVQVPNYSAFIRGDVNKNGAINVSDAVDLVASLFGAGGPACDDARDVNDSGTIDVSDPVYLLSHLFLPEPAPPAPYPSAGFDPTPDGLLCN